MATQPQIRLFLVEDDRIDQMAFTKFVDKEQLPYDYIIAGSIKDAQRYLAQESFDIILSDFQLNDGNAFDLFDSAKDTPIIMVTGTGDEEIAVTAMKSGAYDYLIKDLQGNYLKTLPVTVENALNRRRYELELQEYRERLEELVDERTNELKKEIIKRKHAEQLLKTLNAAALEMEKALTHEELFTAVATALEKIQYSCTIGRIDETHTFLTARYKSFDPSIIRKLEEALSGKISEYQIPIRNVPTFTEVIDKRNTLFVKDMNDFIMHILQDRAPKSVIDIVSQAHKTNAIFAPLIVNDDIMGILSVHSSELNAEDIPTITAFSNQIAATWHKSNLMGDLEESLDQLKRTQDQFLRAQKLEAIGRLAGGIAHDFNNLLTAILGNAELIESEIDETDVITDEVQEIMKAARRASSLTNQLLAFSRRQSLQPKVIDLNEIVINIEKMLRRLIGENISLTTNLDKKLGHVKADPGQMEQLIMNLAINASDAMLSGGTLTVTTENKVIDDDYCKDYSYARTGEYILLKVTDSGTGIDSAILDHIFEPFFSTKVPGQGTGLGLSVVYGIVKQHDGWITVDSEKGQGTSFCIYLPFATEPLTQESNYKIELPTLKGNGERILLIEDEITVSKVATRALLENGYKVFSTSNTSEALAVFSREKGKFDLIFSDVVLPDKSGIELLEEILKVNPEMQVLLSSGYTDHKSQWPTIKEKGFRFIQKPYAIAELLKVIKETIQNPVHIHVTK